MKSKFLIAQFVLLLLQVKGVTAQEQLQNSSKTIVSFDSLFWTGYNNCDTGLMKRFIADDVEFYHDKGGIS
ncbi:MAG: nuclear transport factor 2 family protein, partial [Chitinophagaceae bacterium]